MTYFRNSLKGVHTNRSETSTDLLFPYIYSLLISFLLPSFGKLNTPSTLKQFFVAIVAGISQFWIITKTNERNNEQLEQTVR